MPGTPEVILAAVLVPVAAFALVFALGLGASRLRSVAGLAGLVAAAYAGAASDPRPAALAIVLPAALALLAADGVRLRRRRAPLARDRRAAEPRIELAGD